MNKAEYRALCWASKARVVMADLRIIPRVGLALYGWLCYLAWAWFTGLDAPTTQQVTAFSTLLGAAPAWFGLYTKGGSKGD